MPPGGLPITGSFTLRRHIYAGGALAFLVLCRKSDSFVGGRHFREGRVDLPSGDYQETHQFRMPRTILTQLYHGIRLAPVGAMPAFRRTRNR